LWPRDTGGKHETKAEKHPARRGPHAAAVAGDQRVEAAVSLIGCGVSEFAKLVLQALEQR
jgi:hypothetical protein